MQVSNVFKNTLKENIVLLCTFIFSNIVLVSFFILPLCFFYDFNYSFSYTAKVIGIVSGLLILFFSLFFRFYTLDQIINKLEYNLRSAIFKKLIWQDINYFDNNLPLNIVPNITYDIRLLAESISKLIFIFSFHIPLLIFSITTLAFISSQIFFVLLLFIPGILIQHIDFSKTYARGQQKHLFFLSNISNYLYEVFHHMKTIIALNHQNIDMLIFQKYSEQLLQFKNRQDRKSAFSFAFYFFLFLIVMISVMLLGLSYLKSAYLTINDLYTLLYALSCLFMSIYTFNTCQPYWNRYAEITQNIEKYITKNPPEKTYKKLREYPAHGLLAIHNVSFEYPSVPDQRVIHKINLSIYPGETIVFIGPSGSGKSTLLNLIMGFYHPTQGKIYLDGVQLQDLAPQDLRNQFGIVEQEPQLFTASIYENILYGNPIATDNQVHELIDLVLPKNWISSFPKGLSTVVGPQGHGISVGQKQCIALLRTLLRNPSILLLDEATSGIDHDSEAHIMKNIKSIIQERTTIMVTHKLSNILLASRIVLLDQGHVVAVGTHAELYKSNLFYRKLVISEMEYREANL